MLMNIDLLPLILLLYFNTFLYYCGMKKMIFISYLFLFFHFDAVSQTTIKMDGFFDDWNTNINTYIDDSTDSQGIDLMRI